jgi:NTF2 fold immunity protein
MKSWFGWTLLVLSIAGIIDGFYAYRWYFAEDRSTTGQAIVTRQNERRAKDDFGWTFTTTQPLPGVGRTFGYVPDEATAIRIAVTVWEPIYGKEQIASESPVSATLVNGVWYVIDTCPFVLGGSASANIQQSDGKVLHIEHGL